MTTTNTSYTGKDILVLTDREHVRKRTNVYLGNTNVTQYVIPRLDADKLELETVSFVPAAYKAIGEIFDNAIDEFTHITSKSKRLTIVADPEQGHYVISDNGRGIPIDVHATGKRTPEVVLGSLRSGRNFSDDTKLTGVMGVNGVGAACTNYCSSEFNITIHRDKKKYTQQFTNGAETVSEPKIRATTVATTGTTTGTTVDFKLDKEVFKDVSIPPSVMRNRAMELAMTNPDITVEYNGEEFHIKKGLLDVVARMAAGKTFHSFTVQSETITGEIFVVIDGHDSLDEQMYTWVNSSLLFDGGKCNTQFFNAFFDKVLDHLAPLAKKARTKVTRNDVRQGLLVFADLKIRNPEYDSQAKTRQTGPDFRKELVAAVENGWKPFSKRATAWLEAVLIRATQRHRSAEDADAQKDHVKKLGKKVPGLLDATSNKRLTCRILITEGDSAKGQISMSRNPETTAAFALTGKINNVHDATPAQVLKMSKVTDLLSAIGLTPGKKAELDRLNFGQIVISTDADYDGDDIFTLLVNLFFKFWPELFDPARPFVYRMTAPNVCLVKGKKRIHFTRRAQYEAVKEKYKGYEVHYYKGLGSMSKEDWDMCLSGETETIIPIVNDGQLNNILNLLFSDNADARKKWLSS